MSICAIFISFCDMLGNIGRLVPISPTIRSSLCPIDITFHSSIFSSIAKTADVFPAGLLLRLHALHGQIWGEMLSRGLEAEIGFDVHDGLSHWAFVFIANLGDYVWGEVSVYSGIDLVAIARSNCLLLLWLCRIFFCYCLFIDRLMVFHSISSQLFLIIFPYLTLLPFLAPPLLQASLLGRYFTRGKTASACFIHHPMMDGSLLVGMAAASDDCIDRILAFPH